MPLPYIPCRIFLPIKAKGTGLLFESSRLINQHYIYRLAPITALNEYFN